MSKRRIFFGDIQGCREELERLLEKVRFDPAADQLYSVGDVVNRGPDSAGAIRCLIRSNAICVAGNHELHWLAVHHGNRRAGGRDTLQSLFQAADYDELFSWMAALPVLHVERDLAMIHAGIRPTWRDLESTQVPLRRAFQQLVQDPAESPSADLRFAVGARYCDPGGRLTKQVEPPPELPFQPWYEFYEGRRVVVFGHWAQRGLVIWDRLRGLDTGCVYGKQLSAWIAEEDRLVQVDAARVYCPI